ncbi:hypothetical protein WJX73_003103 [Symbiochloris irregularis]|uniref:Uncharacterized protein n=1 Tax=Symbiochloris irregularis TaxID=706552 RepID=A0AAW1NNH3_9CHLO
MEQGATCLLCPISNGPYARGYVRGCSISAWYTITLTSTQPYSTPPDDDCLQPRQQGILIQLTQAGWLLKKLLRLWQDVSKLPSPCMRQSRHLLMLQELRNVEQTPGGFHKPCSSTGQAVIVCIPSLMPSLWGSHLKD